MQASGPGRQRRRAHSFPGKRGSPGAEGERARCLRRLPHTQPRLGSEPPCPLTLLAGTEPGRGGQHQLQGSGRRRRKPRPHEPISGSIDASSSLKSGSTSCPETLFRDWTMSPATLHPVNSVGIEDSYLLDYFLFLNRYFETGAPVYFVTTGGYNFSSKAGMNAVCSSSGCDSYSLTQKIQYAAEFPEQSYLAVPASSWVDDFIDWLTPSSSCCRLYTFGPHKDEFCPSTVTSLACIKTCINFSFGTVRPSVDQFNKYLPWFLGDLPNIKCPKGGLAAYNTSVDLGPDGQILASRFMAYHKPLKDSQDYTEALRATRALAANITADLRKVPGTDPAFEVFPYTVTNVFYEQYLTVVPEGLFMLSLCLVPTFAVCCLLLGMDLRSGLLNLFSIIMVLVDTVGFMALWGISYNAVSLINLVTAVGISVEFVSHITRSFAVSTKPTRLERAKEATVSMGSAVFAGVAMTNLPGILVLGLAKAQLIQIFFFRLNLLITLLGLLHGLVFLPVILSYLGPDVNPALVLEQKRAAQVDAARTAACPKHSSPACPTSGAYVNGSFEGPPGT